MFKHEKLFVGTDVIDREALCKRLTDNGATIVTNVGEHDSIHIFNSFEGGLFEDCVKKGCRVIGIPCLQETLQSGKALPRSSHPVYSRVMEGLVVSGDVVEEKAKLKNYVHQMNGTWTDELTGNTQYFITTEPGSVHYLWALEFGSNIVQPSWITESWEKRVLSNPKSHLLPPLSGCVVSVTGLSTATRSTIQNLVTHYGGKYSQQLSRKVTHLLCDKPKGRKYVTALAWGIHIVTTNWLFDSVNMKGTADVTRYELPSMPQDMDGVGGGEALYIRSPYARSSAYTPLSSAARSRLNNYGNAPILVRRHRNPIGANYTPLFSLPNSQQLPSHSHQPVFAQTTQIQSGQTSHNTNSPISTSALRQQSSPMAQLHQNRYSATARLRDKDGRTTERYREMHDQLSGLLRMCNDLIDKCEPYLNNTTVNPNSDNNNNNNQPIQYNSISNISTLTNLCQDLNSICNTTELTSTSSNHPPNIKLEDDNKVTTPSEMNNNSTTPSTITNDNKTDKTESSQSANASTISTTKSITNEENTDIEMESDDETPTATTTSSSEQEK
jgi:hypothetical protein